MSFVDIDASFPALSNQKGVSGNPTTFVDFLNKVSKGAVWD